MTYLDSYHGSDVVSNKASPNEETESRRTEIERNVFAVREFTSPLFYYVYVA